MWFQSQYLDLQLYRTVVFAPFSIWQGRNRHCSFCIKDAARCEQTFPSLVMRPMWISTRTFRWADGPRMNLSHRGCNPATIAGLGNDNLTYHQTCDFSQLGYAHGIAMPYTTSFCTKATSLYITLHHRTFVQSLTVINPQREIEYIYIASRCTAFHCEFFFIALSIQVCSAHSILIYIWLVVWNMAFIFPLENIWDSHPN